MNRDEIIARVREAAERVAESEGLEVLEVELHGSGRRRVLRVYIDKPGGVSHRDCETVSEQLGVILDVEDLVPGGSYTLEVSSPGVERKLVRPRDYERFLGQKIKLVLREPVEDQRYWEGVLAAFAGGVVTLELRPGRRLQVPLEQIERANLKFEW
ncbi:MAG: ribosome maturation factor RimP [Bryobacterales bacterium]|nr:ribosome maturation factor RimP [Bryobacteraceae bacterium]MDW8129915.1 ribosome maturation factor RimP [Bryobacterales bacterium]